MWNALKCLSFSWIFALSSRSDTSLLGLYFHFYVWKACQFQPVLDLCSSVSNPQVVQYTLSSTVHHYPFCCKSHKLKSHVWHILLPPIHFQSIPHSVNFTSSACLEVIPFQALQSHHSSSRCHHQSPGPLEEPPRWSPSWTLTPFQFTPDTAVAENFTKSYSYHVTLLSKTSSDFLLLLELTTTSLMWSCISGWGPVYPITFILYTVIFF